MVRILFFNCYKYIQTQDDGSSVINDRLTTWMCKGRIQLIQQKHLNALAPKRMKQ